MGKKSNYIRTIAYVIMILAIAGVASLPALRGGTIKGHDIMFHFGRIQSIAEELQNGQFPVRYESNAWYGYGYVSSLFYGHLLLYIPALLYMAGMPVFRAYNIYVLFINVITAGIGYYSFKRLFNDHRLGLIATLIYTLAPYRLSNVYVRAAVGEYTAMAFIPLVIYGVYILIHESEQKSLINLPLIIGATGIIESHILSTELVAAFVVIYMLVYFRDTIKNIKAVICNGLLLLGVNAYFIVPFIDSYLHMDLYITSTKTVDNLQKDGLYLSQLFGLIAGGWGGNHEWTSQEEAYLATGLLIVLCMIASAIVLVVDIRNKCVNSKILAVGILGLTAGWTSSVYFPWGLFAADNSISKLMTSVQYPWRYMMIMNVCMVITGVYALSRLMEMLPKKQELIYRGMVATFAAIALVSTAYFDYTLVYHNATLTNVHADANWADKLYLPVGTDPSKFNEETAGEVIVSEDGKSAVLPKIAYRGLVVEDGEGRIYTATRGENNLISVELDISEWKVYTAVYMKKSILWRLGEYVSIIAVMYLLVAMVLGYKRQLNHKRSEILP